MSDKIKVHESGIEKAGIYTPAISVEAEGGKVVAYVGSDVDSYSEVFVEFHTNDGRILQLAVVGQRHDGQDEPTMHCDVWNGIDDDSEWSHEIAVGDDSHWHEMNGEW